MLTLQPIVYFLYPLLIIAMMFASNILYIAPTIVLRYDRFLRLFEIILHCDMITNRNISNAVSFSLSDRNTSKLYHFTFQLDFYRTYNYIFQIIAETPRFFNYVDSSDEAPDHLSNQPDDIFFSLIINLFIEKPDFTNT